MIFKIKITTLELLYTIKRKSDEKEGKNDCLEVQIFKYVEEDSVYKSY